MPVRLPSGSLRGAAMIVLLAASGLAFPPGVGATHSFSKAFQWGPPNVGAGTYVYFEPPGEIPVRVDVVDGAGLPVPFVAKCANGPVINCPRETEVMGCGSKDLIGFSPQTRVAVRIGNVFDQALLHHLALTHPECVRTPATSGTVRVTYGSTGPEILAQSGPYWVSAPPGYFPSFKQYSAQAFQPVGTPPVRVDVEDGSGGAVPFWVCQNVDQDLMCGESGEPQLFACGTGAQLSGFRPDVGTWIIVAATDVLLTGNLVCPGPALGGTIRLTYA